jgi:hypothetical protein
MIAQPVPGMFALGQTRSESVSTGTPPGMRVPAQHQVEAAMRGTMRIESWLPSTAYTGPGRCAAAARRDPPSLWMSAWVNEGFGVACRSKADNRAGKHSSHARRPI